MKVAKLKEMTNLQYARSLDRSELPLINKVVRAYIAKVVGAEAPLWRKEQAYNQWCEEPYDEGGWYRARLERAGKTVVFG